MYTVANIWFFFWEPKCPSEPKGRQSRVDVDRMSDYDIRPKPKVWVGLSASFAIIVSITIFEIFDV